MFIKKINGTVRCDIGNCRNKADYEIGDDGVMRGRRLHLCEECARNIRMQLGAVLPPKSPENVVKHAREREQERRYGGRI